MELPENYVINQGGNIMKNKKLIIIINNIKLIEKYIEKKSITEIDLELIIEYIKKEGQTTPF